MKLFLYVAGALVLTLLFELPISYALGKRKMILPSLLGNLLTNPLLNTVLIVLMSLGGEGYYYIALALLEVAAVIAEAVILYAFLPEMGKKKAIITSLLLNGFSFVMGFS